MNVANEPALQEATRQILWPYLLGGVGLALFGWSLYWMGTLLIGIILGSAIGLFFALFGATMLEMPENTALLISGLGGILGAVLGAFMMRMIQNYFFFLVGALLGAPLGWKIMQMPSIAAQEWAQGGGADAGAVALGALIGGGILLLCRRYIIIIVTSLIGASMIAVSVPSDRPELIALPSFVIALVIQTGMLRAFVPKERVDRALRRKD